jgi:hypothetical protein
MCQEAPTGHNADWVLEMLLIERWRTSCKNFLGTHLATVQQAGSRLDPVPTTKENLLVAANLVHGHVNLLVVQLHGNENVRTVVTRVEIVALLILHGLRRVGEWTATEAMVRHLARMPPLLHHGNKQRLLVAKATIMVAIKATMLKLRTVSHLRHLVHHLLLHQDSVRFCNSTPMLHHLLQIRKLLHHRQMHNHHLHQVIIHLLRLRPESAVGILSHRSYCGGQGDG